MTKKSIAIRKTQKFFTTYPIVLFLQHNNLSVDEWSCLRVNIKQLTNSNMLILKNSIVENVMFVEKKKKKSVFEFLFQGPCVAIGCSELSQLITLVNTCKTIRKLLITGALIDKQFLTHLDLTQLLTVDESIYTQLLHTINGSHTFYDLLQSSFNIQILEQIPKDFINCLSYIKSLK